MRTLCDGPSPKDFKFTSLRIYLLFCTLIFACFPENILAADSGQSSPTSFAGGGAIIWAIICYARRKLPIGGWLLYYFVGVYSGLIVSLILLIATFSNYNPVEWGNKFHYFLFIITTIPGQIFLLAQVVLSFFLISQKRRDWKYIEILKKILLADVIFSICSIPIDASLWPQNIFFDIYPAILSLIWFFYFKKSVRVEYVFKNKQWNWEAMQSVQVKNVKTSSWKCSECGTVNSSSDARCQCGFMESSR